MLAHVNHLLRGEESDDDERFVQQLPALWQIADDAWLQCRTTRIDVARVADAEGGNLESVARRERYAWLTELARAEGGGLDRHRALRRRSSRDRAISPFARQRRARLGRHGGTAFAQPPAFAFSARFCRYAGRPCSNISTISKFPIASTRPIAICVLPAIAFGSNCCPCLKQKFAIQASLPVLLCRLADQAQELSGEITAQADNLRLETEMPRAAAHPHFSADRLKNASRQT